ncbi:MAG: tRNA uridine-5-carboxymethylaminomethyl(34) synthesis GTPase MnmE [Gemmataceae bacterium]
MLDPKDTIVALATAPGPGGRAIIRLSGKNAIPITRGFGIEADATRALIAGAVLLPDVWAPLPCDAYVFPAPRSYTGEDVVELHTLGSPPLVDRLLHACLAAGARLAQPGEFTLRAFRAGKLDLTRAEAVLAVIDAESRDELKQALGQLAGGMATPLQTLRDDLLDLLADVEAELDFADEEIDRQSQTTLLGRVAALLARVINLRRQIDQRGLAERPFRVVLAGPPNAGKSSLFNALLGKQAALVSPTPGTTRDYLEAPLEIGGVKVLLVDTAGLRESDSAIEAAAQSLGREQQQRADLVLWCQESGVRGQESAVSSQQSTDGIVVWTKADLAASRGTGLVTSAVTGLGLEELKATLLERAKQRTPGGLAPSLTRCRHHVDACLACLRRAHAVVLEDDPRELLALELRTALEEVGAMAGAVFTEDLLDRIFSRFCIGK